MNLIKCPLPNECKRPERPFSGETGRNMHLINSDYHAGIDSVEDIEEKLGEQLDDQTDTESNSGSDVITPDLPDKTDQKSMSNLPTIELDCEHETVDLEEFESMIEEYGGVELHCENDDCDTVTTWLK